MSNLSAKKRSTSRSILQFCEFRHIRACKTVRAVVVIQRYFRIFVLVRYRKIIVCLVNRLAALYRGWKARLFTERIRQEKLARYLQPLVRGYLARCALTKQRHLKVDTSSAMADSQLESQVGGKLFWTSFLREMFYTLLLIHLLLLTHSSLYRVM